MRMISTIVLLTVALPSISVAQFSYNTIEISLIDVDFGRASADGDGYEIAGSFDINERLFALASYQDQSLDFGIDGSSFALGIGFHDELGDDLDFVASATLIGSEVKALGFSIDDDGFGIAGGVRGRLADTFQLDALLNWVDLDNSGSDTFISLAGRYYFNEQFAISARTNIGDDNRDIFQLGVRIEF